MKQEISFGTWARNQRRSLDLTRQALANQVGCAEVTLRRIENDTLKPSKELALILLEKLGIPENDRQQWVQFARGLTGYPQQSIDSPPAKPLTNLPLQLSTFVGREKEQMEIIQHIHKHRLVTLTGSGGVGKTRLAIKIGKQLLGDYSNGVWLLELAALNDPALLPQTIATTFGLVTNSNAPLVDVLINFLRNKNILLILDNCEHLLDVCAQLADTLLRQCPALKILATSRQALGIMGEVSYRVPSLALPNSQELFKNIKTYESVQLFEERAQLAQSDFTLTKENASSVAEICSRLDGIPLAIELAAAQIVIFSTEQIAARLHESFDLLTNGNRTALPRQQTIRASIDWSWNLSSNAEQTLLRRFSVFSGGWNLESAEAICIGSGIEAHHVLELMTQLVSKSWVNVNQISGGERRFHLHEAIRQYVHEKLIDAGEAENIHSQHLKYFLELAEQDGPTLHGPQQTEWFSRINNERGNIRTALEYASKTNLEAGLYLAGGLTRYWNYFDLREGLSWTTEFIQRPESQKYHQARAKALLAQGVILWYLQQFNAAHSAAQESLELFRIFNDRWGEFDSLMLMGSVMQFLEGMDSKSEFHEKALALAQSIGDEWMQAMAQASLGWDQRNPQQANEYRKKAMALFRQVDDWRNLLDLLGIFGFSVLSNGDPETAKKHIDEAAELSQRMNDKRGMEFVLTGRSQMALMRGEYGQARAFLEENIDFLEEMGNRMGVLWAKARLGYVALREGSENEAGRLFADTVMNFQKDRNKSGLVYTLDKVASLYVVTHQPERAARLLGWSDMTRTEIGDPRLHIEQVDVDHDIEAVCAQIGSTAFEEIYDEGRMMTLEEAVAYAMEGIRL